MDLNLNADKSKVMLGGEEGSVCEPMGACLRV